MFRDSRAELADTMMELVDGARIPREMREAEALCEEMMARHGRHPLVEGAVKELSRRILYEECGHGEEQMNETTYGNNPAASGPQVPTGSVGQYMQSLIDKARLTRKTYMGMRGDGKYMVPGEDAVRSLSGHAMKKGEQAIEFFARTGLSLERMRAMSRSEITKFVEQAERNNEASGVREPRESAGQRNWQAPKPQPSALLVPDYSANDD